MTCMSITHLNLVGDNKTNPREFYRYTNSQRKDSQGIPHLKKQNGSGIAQSDFEKKQKCRTVIQCNQLPRQIFLAESLNTFKTQVAKIEHSMLN